MNDTFKAAIQHALRWICLTFVLTLVVGVLAASQTRTADAASDNGAVPILQWNTFLGGNGHEEGEGIAFGTTGDLFVVGTASATWSTPIRPFSKASDAFVARLNPNGGLKWLTFLGGKGDDAGHGLAVDNSDNVYVTGSSSATWGTPLTAYHPGASDAYLAKLDAAGALQWNTFMGASGEDVATGDWGSGLVIADNQDVLLTGTSTVTWGNPKRPLTNGYNIFVASFNPNGALQWNTFFGSNECCQMSGAIETDNGGNIYLAAYSSETWGTPVRGYSGDVDTLIIKLDSDGDLVWHTFLGGGSGDYPGGFALDDAGSVYVTGLGGSVWGNPMAPKAGIYNAFVAKVNTNGAVVWNTYLGGYDWHAGSDVAVVGDKLYVVGWSRRAWGTNPWRTFADGQDGFVAQLTLDGYLQLNGFLGGDSTDSANSLVANAQGELYVMGSSDSTWGAPLRAYTGDTDAFVAKLSPTALPELRFTKTGQDKNGHAFIRLTAQDTTSGIAKIQNIKSVNANTEIAPFSHGTTTPIRINAASLDPSKPAAVRVRVTNVAGGATIGNVAFQHLAISAGNRVEQTFNNILAQQHILTVVNSKPGLQSIRVQVNGKLFRVVELQDGASQPIDLSSALTLAANTVTVFGTGERGDSALIVIGDAAPGEP